jgi:hypothetical protein
MPRQKEREKERVQKCTREIMDDRKIPKESRNTIL